MKTALVDVGNTRVKWARLDTSGRLTSTAAALHLGELTVVTRVLSAALSDCTRVFVSSVGGGDWNAELRAVFASATRLEFVAVQAAAHGLRCGYREPARLGVDRWVAMIGAYHSVGGAVCVIDAGTTVTFDSVDAGGQHQGGLIFAGPRLTATALDRGTRKIGITGVAEHRPEGLDLLGHDTDLAVGQASMLGLSAGLAVAVATVAEALGKVPPLLLTGGDAHLLAGWLETDAQTRADLVLEGLAYIANQSE